MKKYTNFDEKNKKVLSDYFEFKNNKYMNEKTFKSERDILLIFVMMILL